jgi:prephenate dehydratase
MNIINTIAIQGIKGSFHHSVAEQYFDGKPSLLECMTFDVLVDSVLDQTSDVAVMAIENSIVGSIIPNYALIDTHNLSIIGEYYLDIQHNLMVLSGQNIQDITEVHSHPMALLQCKEFFKPYPNIKLVEAKDTADVAKSISENKIKGIATIASKTASKLYGLDVLAGSIQTIKHNETRFVIVKSDNQNKRDPDVNKASLKFELDHKRGSLAAILNVLSDCKINLTKIQSLPKLNAPWKYAFFIDVTFEKFSDYEKAKTIVNIMAENFKILGEYKNAKL